MLAKLTERGSTNPARPHAFRETNDPGVVAFAGGGFTETGSQVNMLATTTSSLRATRCALPGCGRPRPDPIHAPDED
jgi:hypothetical protein